METLILFLLFPFISIFHSQQNWLVNLFEPSIIHEELKEKVLIIADDKPSNELWHYYGLTECRQVMMKEK